MNDLEKVRVPPGRLVDPKQLQRTQNLRALQRAQKAAVPVVNVETGDVVHWLTFDSHITELYDVAFIPGVRRPMHLGFQTNEIRQYITMEGGLD